MREIYDRNLVHDFHHGDISLIFRNEDEFRKFMEYLEYDYGIGIDGEMTVDLL